MSYLGSQALCNVGPHSSLLSSYCTLTQAIPSTRPLPALNILRLSPPQDLYLGCFPSLTGSPC